MGCSARLIALDKRIILLFVIAIIIAKNLFLPIENYLAQATGKHQAKYTRECPKKPANQSKNNG